MPFYEHVFLARQDLSTAQVDGLSEAFTKILEDGEGKVHKTEYWGLKTLAYRIKKNRKAHYVMLNIEAPAPALHEMERNIGINEDVIRFQTVRVDALEKEPSAMMRKGDRDRERGDRDRGDRGPRGPRRDRDGE
jgi:small subunit ribosomal protein S6